MELVTDKAKTKSAELLLPPVSKIEALNVRTIQSQRLKKVLLFKQKRTGVAKQKGFLNDMHGRNCFWKTGKIFPLSNTNKYVGTLCTRVSPVRRGASSPAGRKVFGRRPNRYQKLRMKSLWHLEQYVGEGLTNNIESTARRSCCVFYFES